MHTILITGCSSGFGLETARLFLDRGWRVIATMRTPRADLLPPSPHLQLLPLDVASADSIAHAIAAAGPIDVLVNNAGIGLLGVIEGIPMSQVREIFETNTFGTMAMTQAVLPQFRARRAGVVINVTSTVVPKNYPLVSVYAASKAAVEKFTEAVAQEVAAFGVQMRLVRPGRSPTTRFGDNARPRMAGSITAPYAEFAQKTLANIMAPGPSTEAVQVAEAIWRAATDADSPFRLHAGSDAMEVPVHPLSLPD